MRLNSAATVPGSRFFRWDFAEQEQEQQQERSGLSGCVYELFVVMSNV